MELDKLTIPQIHAGLVNKEFSSRELTRAFLEKISEKDKEISSFIALTPDLALEQAEKTDELLAAGQRIDMLAGVPMAVKDNILISGTKATCGSNILKNYTASYDATCVKKLKNKGAVILGKTNMDEFAMGSSTENSAFFPTRNPLAPERVPGGSSGGSAAAVAAGFCCYALGSDTGGSIRQPASFCGVVGLKPTYGAVSRYGLVAFASSLDQIGPLAKTAEDARIVFEAISGRDKQDETSLELEDENWKLNTGDEPLGFGNFKIGVPKEYFIEGIQGDVEKSIKEKLKKLEGLGAEIEEINLPHTKYALPTYYITTTAEASANLARYDGIKYGLSLQETSDLLAVYFETRKAGFGAEVKRRIMLGTYVLSAGYYDAYYLKAQKVRTLILQDFEKAFEKVNFIITPTSPTTAFKLGEKIQDPLLMYLSDIFTVSANLAGLPAVSVPVGFDEENLPVGLQIIANPLQDIKILELARIIEMS